MNPAIFLLLEAVLAAAPPGPAEQAPPCPTALQGTQQGSPFDDEDPDEPPLPDEQAPPEGVDPDLDRGAIPGRSPAPLLDANVGEEMQS